ncbi:MAG TPA: anti-sigma factor [Steroidobacteraceae bacterium]|nr:anti-sigma factor [Steroidobacteraceae bacterium]
MTPRDKRLVDPLAAEYVLGTLRGPARRRFERWRASSALVAQRCEFWEEQLISLAREVRPIQPPPHLWQGIRQRLNLPQPRWRPAYALAIAASVLIVIGLSLVLYWRSIQPGPPSELATIAAPSGAAAWQVEVYSQRGQMIVRAGQLPARPANRDFELWALPQGGKPVSLGVLPVTGTVQHGLTGTQQEALAHATQIAVTVEPSGGSPTGQPSGTPVFIAPLRAIS